MVLMTKRITDFYRGINSWSYFMVFSYGNAKNVYASDQEWTALQPVFATSNQRFVPIINGRNGYGETDQMNER